MFYLKHRIQWHRQNKLLHTKYFGSTFLFYLMLTPTIFRKVRVLGWCLELHDPYTVVTCVPLVCRNSQLSVTHNSWMVVNVLCSPVARSEQST